MDESLCFLGNSCLGSSSSTISEMSILLLLRCFLPLRLESSVKRGLSFRGWTEQKEDLDKDWNSTELIQKGCIYTFDLILSKQWLKGLDFLSAGEEKERDVWPKSWRIKNLGVGGVYWVKGLAQKLNLLLNAPFLKNYKYCKVIRKGSHLTVKNAIRTLMLLLIIFHRCRTRFLKNVNFCGMRDPYVVPYL